MPINRSSVWGKLWWICVWIQDVTTRWCLSVQRKIIIGFFIIVFSCSLKVEKSVCLNPSVVNIYLRSRDISATIPSSLSQKGVFSCGFTLAFDLKATKLTWMLKYLTCSPSIRNSCFSQNHGQAGFLKELIQKTKVLAKDGTWILPGYTLARQLFKMLCVKSISLWLVSDKKPRWKKKMQHDQHLDIKRQNLVFILPTGRAPKDNFPLLLR